MMFAGFQKTTLVNFPRRVASAIFLPGCNMRCPYCYNAELVLMDKQNFEFGEGAKNEYYSLDEIYESLKKRKNLISGCVISGGEPLMSSQIFDVILKIKEIGLLVKIDTNGLFPDVLNEIITSKALRPDMIALDIKTSLKRYGELLPLKTDKALLNASQNLTKSISILNKVQTEIEIEYRTVLAPTLVGENEINEMASLLNSKAIWRFSQFMPGNCLNAKWNSVRPYTNEKALSLVAIAAKSVPDSILR